ncbi:MAG: Fe-S cluster assembly protein SufD [Bradymonadaceae bacterium]
MNSTTEEQAFRESVVGGSTAGHGEAIQSLRSRGRELLEGLSRPSSDQEKWIFVKLHPLYSTDFVPSDGNDGSVTESMVEPYAVEGSEGTRLVFVDGEFAPALSETDGFPDEVRVGRLSEPGEDRDVVEEYLDEPAGAFDDDYFANLNRAGARDGAYVVVPSETVVDGVIHLLHLTTESERPEASHPRALIRVGRESRASVVEDYGGPEGGVYLTNPVTELSIGRAATVDHVKIQGESEDAFHVGRTAIDLADSSTYNSKSIAHGARFSRFDIHANGAGRELNCTLDGLAVLRGEQVSDTHSMMDHSEPNSESHQLHKMILSDRAHSVFNGQIYVHPEAQKTDAYQLNRTLLLSDRAKVNTKPQLEIFADDVSCTHGATIGQLEERQMLYLRTRGLDREQARDLLIYAFAAEILETIPMDSVRERVADTIARKMSEGGRFELEAV